MSDKVKWRDAKDMRDRIEELEAKVERLRSALKNLEYWFDVDDEALDAMTPDERADHMRQLKLIRETLNKAEE